MSMGASSGLARSLIARQGTADLIGRTARRFPDRQALIFEDESWTYTEHAGAATELAAGLQALGVRTGDRVAAFGFNSDRYAIAWLATQLIGALHVPINYMLGADECAYILDHSGATLAFVDEELAPTFERAVDGLALALRLCTLQGAAANERWTSFDTVKGATADVARHRRKRHRTTGTRAARSPRRRVQCSPTARSSVSTRVASSPARTGRTTSSSMRCRCTTADSSTAS